jgi:hypothetical protein
MLAPQNALASLGNETTDRNTLARLFLLDCHNVSSSFGIMSCANCQENPCIATIFGVEAIRMGHQEAEIRGEEGNSACRHHSYRAFIHLWMGFTGRGNRVKLPSCVLDIIRGTFPDDTGDGFVGHREE